MSFTVTELHDLIAILEKQPEWRAELRRVLLTDALLSLPGLVQELVEAQRQSVDSLGKLDDVVRALGEAQRTTQDVLQATVDSVGSLKGMLLEQRHQDRPHAFFRPLVTRPHALTPDEISDLIDDAIEQGILSKQDGDDLALADVIVRGRWKDDGRAVTLVTEVSWGVGVGDVQRAQRRAAILGRLGYESIPVVAGDWVNNDAVLACNDMRVWQLVRDRATAPRLSD